MQYKPIEAKLAAGTSFKVIGLGGVGGIVARYLSVFIGSQSVSTRLVLIDGDIFEPNNASRMLFGSYGNKATVVADEIAPRLENSQVTLVDINQYVTRDNLCKLIQEGDIVLLCVDNHATRKLISEGLAKYKNVALISGGNDGVEGGARGTYGNVQVFIRHEDKDDCPAITRYHPEIANPTDKHPDEKNCTELIASTPQILFANMQVACAMLSTLWLYLAKQLHYSELAFDIADGVMNPVPLPPPQVYGRERSATFGSNTNNKQE